MANRALILFHFKSKTNLVTFKNVIHMYSIIKVTGVSVSNYEKLTCIYAKNIRLSSNLRAARKSHDENVLAERENVFIQDLNWIFIRRTSSPNSLNSLERSDKWCKVKVIIYYIFLAKGSSHIPRMRSHRKFKSL